VVYPTDTDTAPTAPKNVTETRTSYLSALVELRLPPNLAPSWVMLICALVPALMATCLLPAVAGSTPCILQGFRCGTETWLLMIDPAGDHTEQCEATCCTCTSQSTVDNCHHSLRLPPPTHPPTERHRTGWDGMVGR
jgi:hypothetical protein